MISFERIKKIIDETFNLYFLVFISLLAGFGFILGSFSLALWFIENTGEIPTNLLWIFKGFGIMIQLGFVILGFKLYFWLCEKLGEFIVPLIEERKEKRLILIEEHQDAMAKKIAKEMHNYKKTKRGKK